MRLFISIELPDGIKQGMAKVQQQLKAAGADAGWTRPEGIHLTLKFLGEVPETKVPDILQALSGAAQGTGALRLSVNGAGAFPYEKNPRVLWLGVSGDVDRLAALQAAIEEAMAKIGFQREERKFSPHLTLARIRSPRPRDPWQRWIDGIRGADLGDFVADHLSLMRSDLRREGAVYTEVGSVGLT